MKGYKSVKLYINYHDEKPVCCCFPENRCSKERSCELQDALIDQYSNIEECMHHDSYKRDKHGVKQVRHG